MEAALVSRYRHGDADEPPLKLRDIEFCGIMLYNFGTLLLKQRLAPHVQMLKGKKREERLIRKKEYLDASAFC